MEATSLKGKRILTYGTFDMLHYGHIALLKRAKKLGDYLIVGVSSDEFNREKGKKSAQSFQQRVGALQALPYVDEVIVENDWDQKNRDIQQYCVDVLVMGSDWEGVFDGLNTYCEVVYLPRTEGVSSSLIKAFLGTYGCR